MNRFLNKKQDTDAPEAEPLKPIRFEELTKPPKAANETGEPPFVNPLTTKAWVELGKTLSSATPEKYPGVNVADLQSFKKAVSYANSGLAGLVWTFVGILPGAFFTITETLMHVAKWGALWWFGSAACIFLAIMMSGNANREAQRKALELGLHLKLLKP